MKLLFLIGAGASGKMTVGQELMKLTGMRLFHNHMTIEPVIDIFGSYNGPAITRIRDVVFEEFARSDQYGMIFTYIWAFDQPSDWAYIRHVQDLFRPYDTEFYCVELVAPQEVRLERNRSENRLLHKASKRDLAFSESRILHEDSVYRCVSHEGEVPFENYLRIDNANLSAKEAAEQIQQHFSL